MAKRRITIKEVKQAYKKTGFKPLRGMTEDIKNNMACPIRALWPMKNPNEDAMDWGDRWYGKDYHDGFLCAIDGWSVNNNRANTLLGYEDGMKVRKSIFKKGN